MTIATRASLVRGCVKARLPANFDSTPRPLGALRGEARGEATSRTREACRDAGQGASAAARLPLLASCNGDAGRPTVHGALRCSPWPPSARVRRAPSHVANTDLCRLPIRRVAGRRHARGGAARVEAERPDACPCHDAVRRADYYVRRESSREGAPRRTSRRKSKRPPLATAGPRERHGLLRGNSGRFGAEGVPGRDDAACPSARPRIERRRARAGGGPAASPAARDAVGRAGCQTRAAVPCVGHAASGPRPGMCRVRDGVIGASRGRGGGDGAGRVRERRGRFECGTRGAGRGSRTAVDLRGGGVPRARMRLCEAPHGAARRMGEGLLASTCASTTPPACRVR